MPGRARPAAFCVLISRLSSLRANQKNHDTMEKVPMTAEGYRVLDDQLKQLKSVERPSVIAAISEARAGRVDNPPPPVLTVLLLGATGGGKSALLNALAGADIARSHRAVPVAPARTGAADG